MMNDTMKDPGNSYLIEIGLEEMPAGMILPAVEHLKKNAEKLQLQVKGSELLTPSVQIIARTRFRNVQGAAIATLPLGELIPGKDSSGNFVIFNSLVNFTNCLVKSSKLTLDFFKGVFP